MRAFCRSLATADCPLALEPQSENSLLRGQAIFN